MKSIYILHVILTVVSLGFTSCELRANNTQSPGTGLTITTSPSASTPKFIATTSYPTNNPSNTPTLTPIPTLSEHDAIEMTVSLIEKDGECNLPCWLGVTPGRTRFDEVEGIFSKFSAIAYTDFASQWASIRVFFPEFVTATHDIATGVASAENGKVSQILVTASTYVDKNGPHDYNNLDFQRLLQRYFVPGIFTSHGPPEKTFLDTTLIAADPATSYPFVLWVIYPRRGFLIRYQGNNIKVGNNIRICPMQSRIEIKIWDIKRSNYEEFIEGDRALGLSTSIGPQPIESVTDFDIETFYEIFKDGNLETCFETPAEIWPH